MRTLRACALVSSIALAACGSDSSTTPDAPVIIIPDAAIDAAPDAFELTFDFSCAGNAAPTTAPANITISGTTLEVALSGVQPTIQAAHATTVTACTGDCMDANALDTQTTAATGCPTTGCTFTTAALATGEVPLDGYLRAAKTGNRTSYVYPPAPLAADFTGVPALMFTNTAFAGITAFASVTQDPMKGNMVLALVDCANMPISDTANVTLALKQGGQPLQGTTQLDVSSLAPQLAGTYAIFNVPAGDIEVGATWKGMPLRAHTVGSFAGATTLTVLRPGF